MILRTETLQRPMTEEKQRPKGSQEFREFLQLLEVKDLQLPLEALQWQKLLHTIDQALHHQLRLHNGCLSFQEVQRMVKGACVEDIVQRTLHTFVSLYPEHTFITTPGDLSRVPVASGYTLVLKEGSTNVYVLHKGRTLTEIDAILTKQSQSFIGLDVTSSRQLRPEKQGRRQMLTYAIRPGAFEEVEMLDLVMNEDPLHGMNPNERRIFLPGFEHASQMAEVALQILWQRKSIEELVPEKLGAHAA